MESLTFEDTRKLLHSIHAIYSLRDPDAFGQDSMTILEHIVAVEATFMISDNAMLNNPEWQFSTPDFGHLFTPDIMSRYKECTLESPLYTNLPLTLNGAHAFSDFVTLPDLQRANIYDLVDYLGVDNQISLVLYSTSPTLPYSEGQVAYYILHQHWNRFTERDRLLLNLFQPHLRQAFETALHCQQQQSAIAQLQHFLDQSGIVFLDHLGTVRWITAQAEQWLQQYIPSSRTNRQLPNELQAWVNNQIAHLNSEDVPEVCSPWRIKQGDRQLVIRLVKDQHQERYLLLLAEESLLSLMTVLEQLGLSPREAQILAAIIRGQSPLAIAQTLQIRPATVRKHLENIYRKLHVQSQTEAIALVLEKLEQNF